MQQGAAGSAQQARDSAFTLQDRRNAVGRRPRKSASRGSRRAAIRGSTWQPFWAGWAKLGRFCNLATRE